MSRLFSFFIFLCVCGVSLAQDIEVKKFELMAKEQTATLISRKDINGNDCALVMVRTLKKGLEFEGWIVGDVDYKDDSYWVFIANGAKHLKIRHPDYQTKDVVFNEHGINSLKGAQVYSLYLVDDTKDIINKIYGKGWNLGYMEVPEKAKIFLNMSARRGDKKAMIALAQLSVGNEVYKGEFTDKNKGLHWINKLLEKGDSACLDSMPGELMHVYACKLIRDGISIDRSPNKVDTYKERTVYSEASKYELKACQKGYSEACNIFFVDYIQSNGLPEYKNDVLRLCKDSALVGNVKAMTCLGYIYENGICETIDLNKAAEWYRKALESNSSNQCKTDLCRVYGNQRYAIDDTAINFIRQQASEGLTEALFQLGCMYEEGRNVEKNVEKAVELYKQCTPIMFENVFDLNRLHHGAAYRLAKIYYDRKNYKKAEALLGGVDELDARYLLAMIIFQDNVDNVNLFYKVDVYNILSDLSKKGYQKATDFIKNNY